MSNFTERCSEQIHDTALTKKRPDKSICVFNLTIFKELHCVNIRSHQCAEKSRIKWTVKKKFELKSEQKAGKCSLEL